MFRPTAQQLQSRLLPWVCLGLLLAFLSGCELVLGPDGPQLSGVELENALELTAEAGDVLSTDASVRAVDAAGDPVPGVELFFRVVEGGGSLSVGTSVSDAQGRARLPTWTLGPVVGTQSLEAGVEGVASVMIRARVRPARPATLEPASEVAEEATVATSAGAPAVSVLDRFGNRVPGAEVLFSVIAGEGEVESVQTDADDEGVAWAGSWTLGTRAGENRLEARVEGGPSLEFVVTGRPMDPAEALGVSLAVGEEDGDDAGGEEEIPWEVPEVLVGHKVPTVPAVRVTDPFGNGVPGVAVRFGVVQGEGYISFPEQTTDTRGRAAPAYWQLGIRSGVQAIEAEVEGVAPVRFEALARPGSPHGADYASLHHQHGPSGGQVPIRPAVRVWDVHGNPVPGVAVVFDITQGSGTLEGAETTTNAEGVARVAAWTLSTQPGENRVRALAGDFGPFDFIAVGDVGGPAQVLPHQGGGQSGPPGVALPTALAARVLDAVGNPVPDVEVYFAVTSGAGSVLGNRPRTNAQGVALAGAWTLGGTVGGQTVEARVEGAAPAVFTATAQAGPPSGVTAYAGSGQSGPSQQGLPVAPAVRVTDSHGNPVSGVPVTFQVTRGGGNVASPSSTSNSDGIAQSGVWTLGAAGGLNQLTATASGVGSPVTFSAFAVPSAWPVKITANVNSGGQVVKRHINVSGGGLSGQLDITQPLSVPPGTVLTGNPGDDPAGWTFSHWEIYVYNADSPAFQSLDNPGPRNGTNVRLALASAPVPAQVTVNGPMEVRLVYSQESGGGDGGGGGGGGDGGGSPGPASQITIHSGNSQTAAAGSMVPATPTVQVRDAQGNGVPNVTVNFQVTGGGGSLTKSSDVTNSLGGAQVGWTLGTAGGTNTMTATVPGVGTVTFTATASGGSGGGGGGGDGGGSPGPASQITIHSGNSQTAAAGSMVPATPTVQVRDAQGNGVPNVTVNFQVTGGGGSLTKSSDVTNSLGGAQVGWTLGTAGGTNTMTATVPGVGTVTFTATASGGSGGGGDDGSGGDGGTHQPPPPPPPPPPGGTTPPAPGAPGQSWAAGPTTIPLRIIEKPGVPTTPVVLTITAGGESRSFYRNSVNEGRTIHVPRGGPIQVVAHFQQSATAGVGSWGFSVLKLKGMRYTWGFGPDQVFSSNFGSWEPFTTNSVPGAAPTPWGGNIRSICGSSDQPQAPHNTFWAYTIPSFLSEGSASWPVDFFVVWLMDHQVYRSGC